MTGLFRQKSPRCPRPTSLRSCLHLARPTLTALAVEFHHRKNQGWRVDAMNSSRTLNLDSRYDASLPGPHTSRSFDRFPSPGPASTRVL